MKLLFDQNISFRITKLISSKYQIAKQVRDLSVVNGSPPKIIWLRIGNSSTENAAKVLLDNQELINDFVLDSNYKDLSCLEID